MICPCVNPVASPTCRWCKGTGEAESRNERYDRILKESKVSSYILRKIDPQLWQQVKAKAALEPVTLRDLIERLLKEWLKP